MKKLSALTTLPIILLALSACGAKKDEGGLTAADNQELNNAAEMLDVSPDSLVASDNVALGNGDEEANVADNEGEAAEGNGE